MRKFHYIPACIISMRADRISRSDIRMRKVSGWRTEYAGNNVVRRGCSRCAFRLLILNSIYGPEARRLDEQIDWRVCLRLPGGRTTACSEATENPVSHGSRSRSPGICVMRKDKPTHPRWKMVCECTNAPASVLYSNIGTEIRQDRERGHSDAFPHDRRRHADLHYYPRWNSWPLRETPATTRTRRELSELSADIENI